MNYELAKQLKDTGFPQKGKGELTLFMNFMDGTFKATVNDGEGTVDSERLIYIPTLSELIIEACGYGVFTLVRNYVGLTTIWTSGIVRNSIVENREVMVTGSTPEEAVARLWLAINKK